MKTFKKILKWVGIVAAILGLAVFTLFMIYVRPVLTKMKKTEVINYDKDLTIIIGGGGNSGILVSDSLVIVIDTKMDEAAEELAKTAKKLAGTKPILVINTHYHSDHCGGNHLFKGATIIAGGNYTKEEFAKDAGAVNMASQWLKGQMDIKMGDDTVTVLNFDGNAHTQSDVFVYLHKRKMLFGGDVILNKQIPALVSKAADPAGYMRVFRTVTEKFAIEKVVPGHGPMGGMEVITDFKQYFVDMSEAAYDDKKKDQLVAKYDDWTQIPFLMSPDATIRLIKKWGVRCN